MRLWRLVRAPFVALDGRGAAMRGGRYSPPGVPVVPFASEAALAVLITMRYLPEERAAWPDDFVLGWTEADFVPERLADDQDEDAVRHAVRGWLAGQRSPLAALSSRVLPEADVVLFNPLHPQASEIMPLTTRPFDFASCLHHPPMLSRYSE